MIKKRVIKGQSQIVSTVLLILIAIAAAGLIIGFVIPFVKNKLSGGDCLEVISKVEIKQGYTCYSDSNLMSIQISIGAVRDLIKGFVVELGGASSKSVNILEDDHEEVRMYGGEGFEIPNSTESRTYNISVTVEPEYIKVYPVLKEGNTCSEADSLIEIRNC